MPHISGREAPVPARRGAAAPPSDGHVTPPGVEFRATSFSYGSAQTIRGIDLRIEAGERFGLLGPSGCGKTTLLKLLAGFLSPDDGEIHVHGRRIDELAPERREIALVFQNYALFPHLTVVGNVAFGLKMRRTPRAEAERRIAVALETVRLGGFEGRYPRELSGGQQQRVALARALATEPGVLLLDEPLSNLDAQLRKEMRVELADITARSGCTTVFVTHDREEALAICDRLAVMNGGRIEQLGTPQELYEQPETAFVARFLSEANLLPASVVAVTADRVDVELDAGGLAACAPHAARAVGERVMVAVRPESVRLVAGGEEGIAGSLRHVTYLGGLVEAEVALADGTAVRARTPVAEAARGAGEEVRVVWPAGDGRALPDATETGPA